MEISLRRGMAGIALGFMVAGCGAGFADGVHSAPYALQDVGSVRVDGRRVALTVTVQNIGTHAVSLQAVSAKGTVRQTLHPAPNVPAGSRLNIPLNLQFYRDVPPAFSLVLDFGLAGTNTALVKTSK